jgi:hypothetical protein
MSVFREITGRFPFTCNIIMRHNFQFKRITLPWLEETFFFLQDIHKSWEWIGNTQKLNRDKNAMQLIIAFSLNIKTLLEYNSANASKALSTSCCSCYRGQNLFQLLITVPLLFKMKWQTAFLSFPSDWQTGLLYLLWNEFKSPPPNQKCKETTEVNVD